MATHEHMAKEDKNTVVLCGGASIVTQTPLFSYDTKCLFCCSDRVIKIFSTSSGHCIRDLRGHAGHVTGIQLNQRNKFQIYSCSTDCSVIKWDYSDGIQLQKYDLHYPLYGLYPLSASEDALLVIHRDLHQDHHLAQYFLKAEHDTKEHHKGKIIIRCCSPDNRHVAVGAEHKLVAAVMQKKLHVYSFKKDRIIVHRLGRKEPNFTCVTCHPTDHCVATGCSDGKIYLWWNVSSQKKVVKTINHWHALRVEHLYFTTEGSYLLSGGHECVLVKWQHNGRDRDFLPRLGASINHVICSPDNSLYATCHSDNVINLVSSSWKLVQTYQGLTRGHLSHQVADPVPTGLLRDPKSNAFVLNGKPGHLQFYDIRRDKQMFNLDITGQNYISPTNLDQPLVITEVKNAAFDHHGNWLATVEHWDDGELTPEMRLKFWQYSSESQSFVLNTNAEQPHDLPVISLRFQPEWSEIKSVPRIVSSSQDGKFKIWELLDDTDIYRTNQRWSCERQGYYRDLPAGQTAFAEDGSLLAVAFASSLTLWDPDTNVMKAVFCHQGDTTDARQVFFGSRSCAHLLVATTTNSLTVWSLVTCSVLWSVNAHIAVLVQDPLSHFMAAFTNDKDLFIFSPLSSNPVYSKSEICDSDVIAAVYLPREKESANDDVDDLWQTKSQLYFMNRNQRLLTLSQETRAESEETVKVRLAQQLPQTPFSLLIAELQTTGVQETSYAIHRDAEKMSASFVKELLNTPAHVLPPISSLSATFMKTLLIQDKSRGFEDEEDFSDEHSSAIPERSDSESDMDVDSGIIVRSSSAIEGDKVPISSTEHTIMSKSTQSFNALKAINKQLDAVLETEDYSWMINI